MSVRRSKVLSVSIDCPSDRVYAFVSNPENFPKWVTSFVRSAERTPAGWVMQTTGGPVAIEFVPQNDFGVLDHVAKLPSGDEVRSPMRVVPNGDGSEVTFILFQLPEMSDEQFAEDAGMIERDLETLKRILEQ